MATKKFLDLTGLSKYDELLKAKVAADIKSASDTLSAEIAKRVILDKGEDTDTVALTVTDGKLTASVKGNVVVDAEYSTVKSNAAAGKAAANAWEKFLAKTDISEPSPVLGDLATKKEVSDAASAAQAAAIAAAATDASTKADAAKDAAIAAAATDATTKANAAKDAAIAAAAADATSKANAAQSAAEATAAADATSKANAAQSAAAEDATTKANAAKDAAIAAAAEDATTKANAAQAAAITAANKYTDEQIDEANSAINTEIAGLKGVDTALDGRISDIETLINSDSDGFINKVSEVINFFNDVKEGEVYTDLVAKVAANEAAITKEVSDREAADAALDAKIEANTTAINKEVSDREAADTALDNKITAEASAREAADAALDAKITANAKAITDGDAATLASAKTYTDEAKNAANAYTDSKIAALDVCEAIDTADIVALFD